MLTSPGLRRLTPGSPWADLARPFRAQGKRTNCPASVAVRLGFQVVSVEAVVLAVQELGAESYLVEQQLPFPISTRPWSELSERERGFFGFGDAYLPLHPNHAAQIALLASADVQRLTSWASTSIPAGWPDRTEQRFPFEEKKSVCDCWNDEVRRAEIRHWLFERGIPLRRTVYLIYEKDRVVQTTWRMVVRYWDAFSWSVGYAMIGMDHMLQWACCFHHEEFIVFGSRSAVRGSNGPALAPEQ
ncbi:MAG: hypothetical protein ACKVP0_16370 [Pirellulaceae bacterium]